MRKTFTVLFCSLIIALGMLIIGFIPMKCIENKVVSIAKKHSIIIYPESKWSIRLITLDAVTENFAFDVDIEKDKSSKYKLSGHSDNFIYNLINSSFESENLSIDIFLEDDENMADLINTIATKISKLKYNIYIKNLFINIYIRNYEDKSDGSHDKYKLMNEITINKVKIIKNSNKISYGATIGIDKSNKNIVLLTIDNTNDDARYELNGKIENNNFYCYIYASKKGGKINCEAKKISSILKDIGINNVSLGDNLYKKILDKKLIINADIRRNNDCEINGKIIINNDIGSINYRHKTRTLGISFSKLDLDKTTKDVDDSTVDSIDAEETKTQYSSQAMFMSGKENKIISSAKKQESFESINSFEKVVNLALTLLDSVNFKSNLSIKEGSIFDIPFNLITNISKKRKEDIEITALKANFGHNLTDSIIFKQSNGNTSETRSNNFIIHGTNIDNLIRLFNLDSLNPNLSSTSYGVSGNIKMAMSRTSLDNVNLYVDGRNILNLELSKQYNFERKSKINSKKISIQNIDINRYYNIDLFYKKYYDAFLDIQSHDHQDAIFLKKIFKKRESKKFDNHDRQVYILNNVIFEQQKIENLAYEYEDNKKFTTIYLNAKSNIFDGKFTFDIRSVDEKDRFAITLDAKTINTSQLDTIFNGIEMATKVSMKDIFHKDVDYNIPSFIGLYGKAKIDIDNFVIGDKILTNINGIFNINDGIVESNNLTFKYGNGEVISNAIFSLQGRPELKLGFSLSGVNINNIVSSPLDGHVSLQFNCNTYGFNPVQFFKKMSGKGRFVVQNIKIPHFDLLNMSNDVIKHGIKQDINYYDVISNKSLYFKTGTGNLLLDNGVIKGDISMMRELVSGSAEFEYNLYTETINKLASSFAVMMARKRFETPFPVYIAIACNGESTNPKCLFNWEQLKYVLGQNQ